MKNTTPIKRNAAIAEFSRDHHFALLLVWKIREGIKKSIEPERISKYVIHFFDTELKAHFKDEEALLFSQIPSDNKLRIQAENDHKAIYRLVSDLQKNQTDEILLQSFADTLEKHIRFEERELFNYIQDNISETALTNIAASLKTRDHESEKDWTDIFWK
jgi:hemerythrin-like domain-containing protein